ncbi:hypothetical protein [Kordia sp.]|uniref:hypothetical protein n=1 Tax=Kordia sp. TaxID=1965332 RepID=UPI003B5D0495
MKKSMKKLALNKKAISKISANATGGEGATLTITIPKTIIYKTWWAGCNGGGSPSDLCA